MSSSVENLLSRENKITGATPQSTKKRGRRVVPALKRELARRLAFQVLQSGMARAGQQQPHGARMPAGGRAVQRQVAVEIEGIGVRATLQRASRRW
jgi:hypothetical protein